MNDCFNLTLNSIEIGFSRINNTFIITTTWYKDIQIIWSCDSFWSNPFSLGYLWVDFPSALHMWMDVYYLQDLFFQGAQIQGWHMEEQILGATCWRKKSSQNNVLLASILIFQCISNFLSSKKKLNSRPIFNTSKVSKPIFNAKNRWKIQSRHYYKMWVQFTSLRLVD